MKEAGQFCIPITNNFNEIVIFTPKTQLVDLNVSKFFQLECKE
jgi:hypothetical protein